MTKKNAPLNCPYSQGAMRPKRFTAWQPWSLSAKRTWRVDHGTLELKQPVVTSILGPKTTLLGFVFILSFRKEVYTGWRGGRPGWGNTGWLTCTRLCNSSCAESENKTFHSLICRWLQVLVAPSWSKHKQRSPPCRKCQHQLPVASGTWYW